MFNAQNLSNPLIFIGLLSLLFITSCGGGGSANEANESDHTSSGSQSDPEVATTYRLKESNRDYDNSGEINSSFIYNYDDSGKVSTVSAINSSSTDEEVTYFWSGAYIDSITVYDLDDDYISRAIDFDYIETEDLRTIIRNQISFNQSGEETSNFSRGVTEHYDLSGQLDIVDEYIDINDNFFDKSYYHYGSEGQLESIETFSSGTMEVLRGTTTFDYYPTGKLESVIVENLEIPQSSYTNYYTYIDSNNITVEIDQSNNGEINWSMYLVLEQGKCQSAPIEAHNFFVEHCFD